MKPSPLLRAFCFATLLSVVLSQSPCNLTGGTAQCGRSTFCFGDGCVECVVDADCATTGCVCTGRACRCNAAASNAAAVPGSGGVCSANSDCSATQYCFLLHCSLNGGLNGCNQSPPVGRCRDVPTHTLPPVVVTPAPSDDDPWLVPFIIVAAVLGCLLLCLLIYLCCVCCSDDEAAKDEANQSEPQGDDPEQQASRPEQDPNQGNVSPVKVNTPPNTSNGKEKEAQNFAEQPPPASPPHRMSPLPVSETDSEGDGADVTMWVYGEPNQPLGVHTAGRRVIGVDPGSPADAAGMAEGLRVHSVAGEPLADRDLADALQQAKNGPQPFVVEGKMPAGRHPQPSVVIGDTVDVMDDGQWREAKVVGTDNQAVYAVPIGQTTSQRFSVYQRRPQLALPANADDLPDDSPHGRRGSDRRRSSRRRRSSSPTSSRSSSSSRSSFDDFIKGDRVIANYNGAWYPATVMSQHDGRYAVNWGDGLMTEGLRADEMLPQIPLDTPVLGLFHGEWWPAVVIEMSDSCLYTLRWDRDSTLTYGMRPVDVRIR